MTEPLQPETTPGAGLQFENAEYAAEPTGTLTCAACAKEISQNYYEVSGKVLCDLCREAIGRQLAGGASPVRFLRACLFGSIAAVGGFLIYFAVTKATNMEIGLISILVGFMVGAAVRAGARHRGGFVYQALAVFLTYSAIAASYSVLIIMAILSPEGQKMRGAQEAELAKAAKPAAAGEQAGAPAEADKPAAVEGGGGQVEAPGSPLAAIAVLLGLLFISPIYENLQSPIGLLIVGFALWEAWKLNKRPQIVFNGPYDAAGASPPPATELPSHA